MEGILNIIFYIATGLGVLTLVFVWLGEVKLNGRRFKWYFYIPHALINAGLGVLAPAVFVSGVLDIIINSSVFPGVLYMFLWTAALVANNLGFFFLFRSRKDLSLALYWCAGLFGLFILSFWILRSIPV